jgi:succinyl-CoA synthetase alpha subunit
MLEYGTKVVAGVTPGKGGRPWVDGKVPVFDTVREAVEATGANTSIIYVPARFAPDAIFEAADAGIPLIVCITEGIPVPGHGAGASAYLDAKGVRLIGPNCPGLLTPGEAKVGIMPGHIAIPGQRRRRLPLRHADLRGGLRPDERGMGQSTCVGIGGDPDHRHRFIDCCALFEADPRPSRW